MSELISKSGAMVLKTLKILKGRAISGLSNGEVAQALGTSPANATRYLNTLISEGLVIKLETDRFALSVGMLAIAQATTEELANTHNHARELNQRIAAQAAQINGR